MLYNLNYILHDIETCINNKKPFSISRLGDGDLKLLTVASNGHFNRWKFNQQGIPVSEHEFVCKLYKESCNNANYVSSFDMYFDGTIWRRPLSRGMRKKIQFWKRLYRKVGIKNENYCSPEIGFLFFLNEPRNLFSILANKRICLITCFPRVEGKINGLGYNCTTFLIPGRNEHHYKVYYTNIEKLSKIATSFDAFLVGAGTLGRGYSNCIKANGGVAIDIGQVFDSWADFGLPKRLKRFLIRTPNLTFRLQDNAKQFRKFF